MSFANEPTEVLSAPSGLPAAGTVLLGRYRLRSLLGSGGTADVWAAHDEKRDRMVTIKLLRDREDPERRRRFLDEGLWLETIEHPGIVRALGRHDVLGLTLIVFEYIEGTTLAERLARVPQISPREATWIAARA
jgi:serine/threonine-protein kinase